MDHVASGMLAYDRRCSVRPMSESEDIERAGKAPIEAVPAPSKVILIGSYVGGDGQVRGDYDFLVIERDVDDRVGEMARLSTMLGHMLIPAQVVVATEEEVRKLGSAKGSTIHEAVNHGRVIVEC
jgi:predicted nucleotidyltransferase